MIIRLIILLAFIAVPCFAADTRYPTPSHSQINQIKKWWKPENRERPYEKLDIKEELDVKDVKPIRLKSGEKAFVASVWFGEGHGARCDRAGILLVRPALQEARQIDPRKIYLSAQVSEVIDFDDGRISGVVTTASCTSTGETHGSNTLLYFDEWQPVTILSRGFQAGHCGRALTGLPCHSEEVKWFFRDLDGDGTNDLVELIINCDGGEPDEMTCKTAVNAYLIKDLQLVPAPPGLIQTNVTESQGQAKPEANSPTDMQGHKSQGINAPDNEQPLDNEVLIAKCRSGLDQAVTTARDILSQFGLTGSDTSMESRH